MCYIVLCIGKKTCKLYLIQFSDSSLTHRDTREVKI